MIKNLILSYVRKLVVLSVLLAGLAVIGYVMSDHKDYPGKAEFEQADNQIDSNRDGVAHGNTAQAKQAADQFAGSLKALQGALFTGGSGRSYASGGEFVTYCHQNEDSVAFIVHVPELRNYKDAKTRNALATLAWSVANGAVKKFSTGTNAPELIVGLRGFASYGPIWSGTCGGDPLVKTDSPDEKRRIYPVFVARTGASGGTQAAGTAPAAVAGVDR